MSSGSRFANFPARFYLRKYYAHIGPENAALMRAAAAAVASLDTLGTVVELGGGPSLCGLLAMVAATDSGPHRVVWVDIGAPNGEELAAWLRDDSAAFDWGPALRWLERETGADAHALTARLRAAHWDVRRADLWDGLPAGVGGVGDVVASYFLAEAASDDADGFVELTRRVREAARPGARVALAYVRRSEPYRLEDATLHPAFAVDEHSLLPLLHAAGLQFAELEVRRGPRDEPPARPGYAGLVLAHGRLREPLAGA